MNILSILTSVLSQIDFNDLFKGKEAKKQELLLKLNQEITTAAKLQTAINRQEAKHQNIWVSGWRPFIGWCCGSALAYNFILQPFFIVLFSACKIEVIPPALEIGQLVSILLGMLGLAGMRTTEKIKLK